MSLPIRRQTGAALVFEDGRTLTFDAVTSETPTREARVSRHPTERGRPLTDHVQLTPITLPVMAEFTDTPTFPAETEPPAARAQTLYRQLLAAYERRELVTYVSQLEVISSLVISRVSAPRNPDTGTRVVVDIQLVEVAFARDATGADGAVIPDRLVRPRSDRGRPPKDPGKQSPTPDGDVPKRATRAKAALDQAINNGIAPPDTVQQLRDLTGF